MLKTNDARKLVLVGAAAIATLGALAAPAQAGTATLAYSCDYPFIGGQPTTATTSLDLPASVVASTLIAPVAITTDVTSGGNVPTLFSVLGATTVDVTAKVASLITATDQTLPPTFTQTALGADATASPFVANAAGLTPGLKLLSPGPASVAVTGLSLEILAKDSNGDPLILGQDGEPTALVPCVLTPGQDTALESLTVTPNPNAPIITSAQPSTLQAGKKATVKVDGTKLGAVTSVAIAGSTVPFEVVSNTRLKVKVPALAAGTYALGVSSPNGRSSTTITVQ